MYMTLIQCRRYQNHRGYLLISWTLPHWAGLLDLFREIEPVGAIRPPPAPLREVTHWL